MKSMKTHKTLYRIAFAVVLALGLGLAAAPVQADVLLVVDISNPAAVTFTATGSPSLINDSSASVQTGIDLLSFFTSDPSFAWGDMVSSNLTAPSNQSLSYNSWMTDGVTTAHLNLFGFTGLYSPAPEQELQVFSTLVAAFTGTATIDLSAYAAILPSIGDGGDIWVGTTGFGSNAVIGQWTVVPEPATLSLLALGGLAMIRRRRAA